MNKCLENNITDYKTCYTFHNFKHNDNLLEEIKNRYIMMESFNLIIKNCVDNNIDKTTCYNSKKNNYDYNFPISYMYEFNYMYDKIKNNN